MLKPNIRGYPRGSLRPGLRGWRVRGSQGGTVLYRLPWRRNWVHQMCGAASTQLLVSRSGRVYLLRDFSAQVRLRKSYMALLAAATILGLGAIGLSVLSDDTSSKPAVTEMKPSQSPELGCIDGFKDPSDLVSKWALGNLHNGIRISESNVILLGGIKSTRLKIECFDKEQNFKSLWVKANKEWKLKNLVRLEN